MTRADSRRTRGFTLIEMISVVVLIGLFAAAAALSFRAPLRAARAREALQLISSFDRAARQWARRSGGEVEIVIDPASRQLLRRGLLRDGETSVQTTLPHGIQIAQVRTRDALSVSGPSTIRVSPRGLSSSYALQLSGPAIEQWVLVAGLSGQMTLVSDEAQLDAILQGPARRTPRRDAD